MQKMILMFLSTSLSGRGPSMTSLHVGVCLHSGRFGADGQLAFGMLSVDRLSTDSVWSNLLPELSCRIFRLSSPAPGILVYADDLIFTSYD